MSFFNKKPNNCDKKLEKFERKAPIWSHFSPSSVDMKFMREKRHINVVFVKMNSIFTELPIQHD